MKRIIFSLGAIATMAACGGASTNTNQVLSYAELKGRADQNLGLLETVTPSERSTLPASGSADFSGVVAVFESDASVMLAADQLNYGALGELNANVDFATGRVTGTGRGFYEVDDINSPAAVSLGQIAGSLAIDGALRPTGNAVLFDGAATGRLTKVSGAQSTYNVRMTTGLAGANNELFVGEGTGIATTSGQPTAAAGVALIGNR